ncbi:hypothetical protein EGT29_24600 [Pigmentiphaga sp. H8]|uniref:BrnA antitoxin family protein n=1 Tax=Pigmentiphaga sp. H8 TaxID=2488560 RepID=UPI000F5A7E52|nr:BrnA antitoxin family protein [Pigmentiphaga sp. H8]AZG10809.1 hypothetical protein EGT29_24600 [Pigmentiphaga sp. H8]
MSRNKRPLTDDSGEARELGAEDLKHFGSPHEVLPESLRERIGTRRRGPQKTPTKVPVTIRLSREVVERFKASGTGWQTRVDTALKEWLETHEPA